MVNSSIGHRIESRIRVAVLGLLTAIVLSGCDLCGCEKADIDAITRERLGEAFPGEQLVVADLEIDNSIFFFIDDKFELRVVSVTSPGGGVKERRFKGTFNQSGNNVTFVVTESEPPGQTPFILNTSYQLTCEENPTRITLTNPQLPFARITFVCRN